jgi:serine phosphatase RsbU (regulator of sigma subunit)
MSSVRQAIRGAAHVHADPGVMLTAANRALDDPDGRFVTAFVGVIDPGTSTIAYQSAGHPPPMLRLPGGSVVEFARGGVPLGVNVEGVRRTNAARLPAGSLLVLYTDGLVESTHDMLEGEQRIRTALAGDAVIDAANPAQMLHDLVLTDGSRDDVAILTIAAG